MWEGLCERSERLRWNHTASLAAVLLNIHRDPRKGRMVQPDDLHPYQRKTRRGLSREQMAKQMGLPEVEGAAPATHAAK